MYVNTNIYLYTAFMYFRCIYNYHISMIYFFMSLRTILAAWWPQAPITPPPSKHRMIHYYIYTELTWVATTPT